MVLKKIIFAVVFGVCIKISVGADKFNTDNALVQTIKVCHRNATDFDPCLRNAANALRTEFKTGIPELNISSFDPFFIKEATTGLNEGNINVRLTLRNVYERGWTQSKVTSFKTNIPAKYVKYNQFFPEKYLDGEYELKSNVIMPIHNEGRFSLSLFNYTQVTTTRWAKARGPVKVRITALGCGDMKLHLTNLVGGRVIIEGVLDRIINAAWRPGFNALKPVIDDLVSKSFTQVFNDRLQHVPFELIIPE